MNWPSLRKCFRRNPSCWKPHFSRTRADAGLWREDVGGDLHQAELLKGVLAQPLNNGGHDAPAPIRLRQPVADLGSVGFADLEAVEAAAADQGVVGTANRKMNRTGPAAV